MGTAIRALGRMSSLQKLQVNRGDRANSESSVFSDSDSNSHSDLSSQNPRSTSSTKLDDLPDLNIQMAATATSNTTENENVFNLQQQQNPTPAEENKDISPTTDYCNNCIKGQNQESDLLNESTSTSRTLSAQSDTDTSENASMRFVRKMVDCQAFTGDVVRFDITVLSEHDQDIHWYQEDVEIVEDDRHSFVYNNTGECSLIIKNVSEEDDGEFTCKASNCFGEISCSAEIIICGTGAF